MRCCVVAMRSLGQLGARNACEYLIGCLIYSTAITRKTRYVA